MPKVVSILQNYWPVRLFAGGAPSVRRHPNHVARIPTLRPVGLQDFLALEIPPRTMLLDPILPERSLSMLYAPRGIGKSWLGLSVGLAVASGSPLLRWTVPRPRNVLYVDGEMPLAELQLRLASIKAGMGVGIPNHGFRILAADNTEAGINLSSNEGQQALVWGVFCQGVSARRIFLSPSVFLFDLKTSFFVPICASLTPARAGAVKVGRRANIAACSALARPHLDGFQYDGTLGAIGMTIRGELAFGREGSRHNLVFGRSIAT